MSPTHDVGAARLDQWLHLSDLQQARHEDHLVDGDHL